MSTYRDGFITVNGLRLHYLDWGTADKPPLVLLHGGSAYAHWWDWIAPALAPAFHVFVPDQRGHGDSDHTDPPAYGTRHYVDDLRQFVTSLGLHKPVLIGHSMGGHNALIYATQYAQDLTALILVDTPASYSEGATRFLAKLGAQPAREFNSLTEAISAFRLLPRENLTSPDMLRTLAAFAFTQLPSGKWTAKLDRRTLFREPIDGRPLLSHITCPTLFVRAEHSPVLSLDKLTTIMGSLPNGRWVEIKNCHHHIMLDNPTGLIQAVQEFLAGLS